MIGGGLLRPIGQAAGRVGTYGKPFADDIAKAGFNFYDDIAVVGFMAAPLVSRPVQLHFVGGAVAGLVYDIAYSKSPDVSSERNATKVASGGTSSGKDKNPKGWYDIPQHGYTKRRGTRGPCKPGYVLRKSEGLYPPRWICVPKR